MSVGEVRGHPIYTPKYSVEGDLEVKVVGRRAVLPGGLTVDLDRAALVGRRPSGALYCINVGPGVEVCGVAEIVDNDVVVSLLKGVTVAGLAWRSILASCLVKELGMGWGVRRRCLPPSRRALYYPVGNDVVSIEAVENGVKVGIHDGEGWPHNVDRPKAHAVVKQAADEQYVIALDRSVVTFLSIAVDITGWGPAAIFAGEKERGFAVVGGGRYMEYVARGRSGHVDITPRRDMAVVVDGRGLAMAVCKAGVVDMSVVLRGAKASVLRGLAGTALTTARNPYVADVALVDWPGWGEPKVEEEREEGVLRLADGGIYVDLPEERVEIGSVWNAAALARLAYKWSNMWRLDKAVVKVGKVGSRRLFKVELKHRDDTIRIYATA